MKTDTSNSPEKSIHTPYVLTDATPPTPTAKTLTSSDWVGELEAELGRLNALRTRSANEKRGTWDYLYTACEAVLEALKDERRRSPTHILGDASK